MLLFSDCQSRQEQLKRSALVLMLAHLQQEGYGKSVLALEAESGVLLSKYEVCDNVDLATIIQEYEAYYAIKFGRAPKLIRKVQTCYIVCSIASSQGRPHSLCVFQYFPLNANRLMYISSL